MSLLYVDVKNHQDISSLTPGKQMLQLSHRKDHNAKLNKFLIDPQKILLNFEPDKSIVEKVLFLNNHSQKINFKIEPPKKNTFAVKCKKTSLNPKESCQIFLTFAGQTQKILIQDQFLIIIDKQKIQLHVPILCRPKIFKSTSSRKLSLRKHSAQLKQNETNLKQKFKSRPLTLRRRKTGHMDFNSEIDNMVNDFLEKFHSIHEFVKQKNVKKQIFIGEKALSGEKHRQIIAFNEQVKRHIDETIKRKVESRVTAQFSEEGPVTRNFQGLILRWSKEKNIPKLIYDKGLSKVNEQVRKYLVNLRFDKIHRIFSLYREFVKSNEHNNLPKHKKQQIYIEKLQKKIHKKSEISLELTFDRSSFITSQLEVQNEVQSYRKQHLYEINPRIGFDNWIAIEESIPFTHELMDYQKKQAIAEWLCHPKLQENHLGVLTGRQQNSKYKTCDNKQPHQNSYEMNGLISQLKFYPEPEDLKNQGDSEPVNRKAKQAFVSRGEIKINQAYNLTSKVFASMFSAKSIKSASKEEGKIEPNKFLFDFQEIQNHKITQNLNLIYPHSSQSQKFMPFIQSSNELVLTEEHLKSQDSMVINELKRPRTNMEYMRGLRFSREEVQANQEHKRSLLDTLIGYKNKVLRKVPKQDKYEFDRLDDKAEQILEMIERLEKDQEIENYKLRGELELQIPNKNQNKTYQSQHASGQNFEALSLYKHELLGKSNSLQAYLFQTAKHKPNSIFII